MSPAAPPGRSVGIELCSNLVRGVLLGAPDVGIARAGEVALTSHGDDQSVLDALIRLRAELGAENVPARLATFPSGSWMRRIDVTGKTGPELNAMRGEIDRRHRAASTLLIDDGPRRWLHVLHWPDAGIRRIEALAERAGFVDVAVEPSPVALARVVDDRMTLAERFASTGEASATVLDAGQALAAVSISAAGRPHPTLAVGDTPFSTQLFDDVVDADAVAELVESLRERSARRRTVDAVLRVDDHPLARFPPHDLRASERQCVAVGAAAGAAGLAGRIRPVDIISDAAATTPLHHRPWVVERMATVTQVVNSGPGATRRTFARLLPRRKR